MQRIFAQPKREHMEREILNTKEDENYYPMINRLRVALSFGDFSIYEIKVCEYLIIRRFGARYVVPTVTIPEMAHALQMERSNVRRTVKRLVDRGVVEVCGDFRKMPTYRIYLDVRKWKSKPIMKSVETSGERQPIENTSNEDQGQKGHREDEVHGDSPDEVRRDFLVKSVETPIAVEKDFKKENKKENIVGTEKDGSDESLSSDSLEEDQNQNKGGDPMIDNEKSKRDKWPPFLQEQAKAREERDRKRKLSSGSLRKEGLTDEEIASAFNGKISPEQYRELVKDKTHDEVLKIQANLMA